MSKELEIHLAIGIGATIVIFLLWKRAQAANQTVPSDPNSSNYNGIYDTSPVY